MTIEPYGEKPLALPTDEELGIADLAYKERRTLGREARTALFREHHRELMNHLQLGHLTRLKDQQRAAIIRLGNQVKQDLEENLDNPLVTEALWQAWRDWEVEVRMFLRSVAQRPNY